MESLIEHTRFWDRALYIATGSLAAISIFSIVYSSRPTIPRKYQGPIRRPIAAIDNHPYHHEAIPGGRDVNTPYGRTRVYEWGPEHGRKVLFVHGISTPCISMAALAARLARQGCRVMLFDLYGRGYSDAPDPRVYRQDTGLYSAQILSALATSRVDWMAGFTLVGYSLGGGIAAAFTYHYPALVDSLVLIAPSGVMRPSRISWSSKVLYGGLLPDWLVFPLVAYRIRGGVDVPTLRAPKNSSGKKGLDVADAAKEEVPGGRVYDDDADNKAALFENRPPLDLNASVIWQTTSHPGFVPAFVSSIRYAPIHDEYERWQVIGKRCEMQRAEEDQPAESRGLLEGRVLVLLGAQDKVTLADETIEDATAAFGRGNVTIQVLDGGHDLPSANSDACMQAIMEHWEGI
jgi:pimeloyl-ACP methyl ester carboxylesterase